MSFTTVMPGSGRVGSFRIPPVHGKLGISTSNHEPVHGITGHDSTDFTSEFLQCCHALTFRVSVVDRPHFAIEPCRRLGVGIVNSTTLFPLHGTTKVGGLILHPKLGHDFADQLSMTEKLAWPADLLRL